MSRFDRGVLTISLDFELVWGSRDLLAIDELKRQARITREQVFPELLRMFSEADLRATWATVGHLFLAEGTGRLPDVTPPRHAWQPDWMSGVPAGTEAEHPEHYGRSLVVALRDAGQEVGSHSFTHPVFGDAGCSPETAHSELRRCKREAEALGITLRSFVFPRNVQGHFDALVATGFDCWRGPEPVWYRNPDLPKPLSRLAHLCDAALAGPPPAVMPYLDPHGLVCIPASASILPVDGRRRYLPLGQRTRRCTRGLDAAARSGRICHLWFHPINFASDPKGLLGVMASVLDHASRLRDRGDLEFLSMSDVADRVRAHPQYENA